MLQGLGITLKTGFNLMVKIGLLLCAKYLQALIMGSNKAGYIVKNITRLPVLIAGFSPGITGSSRYWKTLKSFYLSIILLIATPVFAVTPPGTTISSTATADFDYLSSRVVAQSNTVTVVTTIIQTPSFIKLYQYDVSGNAQISIPVPTQYASSGPPASNFVVSPDPEIITAGGGVSTLDPNIAQGLSPVTLYSTGEPVYIEVDDRDQNLDATKKETVIVVVTSTTGDREELLLTETGVNTGIFIGYVQSASHAANSYDGILSLGENTNVFVQYTDKFDPSDSSLGESLVDPFGVVFSSLDGSLQDGAVVTLLDASGNPAQVFGNDGLSSFANPIVTGSTVTDSGGTLYNFPEGSYRFPRIAPGEYTLVVTPAGGYQAPSESPMGELADLSGGPFELVADASYAKSFILNPGPPLHVDIPVDPPSAILVIEKSVSKDTAAIGDFVQYTLKLDNIDTSATARNIVITDTLPVGLRYQAGSARYDGNAISDPVISSDGRRLQFSVSDLAPETSTQVKYITELSVGTRLGKAVNSVIAEDDQGVQSNTAFASIIVTEDLFASRSFIAGRVIVGECDEDGARINPGLPSARLFMEDGTYAATDENGRYHFEGIRPGTHIVQLDKASIPDHLEVIDCVKNTRFAGTPYSQFVDLQGGTLWRVDFYVREKPPLTDTASLYIQSELHAEDIKYSIEVKNGDIPVKNYRLIVNLPEGIDYDLGSSVVDDVAIPDPYVNENVIVYRFGDLGSNWKKKLKLRGRIREKADGELITSVLMLMDTAMKKNIRSVPVKNKLEIERQRVEHESIIYQAFFDPMGVELSASSKKRIQQAFARLGDVEIKKNEIKAYADNRPIQPRSWWLYGDNTELSHARAEVLRDFLINELNLDRESIIVKANGESSPLAKNTSIQGRSLNRRAELVVSTSEIVDSGKVELIESKSEVSEITLQGQPEFKVEKLIEAPAVPEQLDISTFDEFWIKTEKPGYQWLMPDKNFMPAQASVNIAIKHKATDDIEMRLNGEILNPLFYFGSIKNKQGTVSRSYWQGVHLSDGNNRFEFIARDKNGKIVTTMQRNIIFSGIPVRAEIAEQYSRLIADGRHLPVIALKVFDKDGLPARPGSRGKFIVAPPFLPKQEVEAFQTNRLSGLNRKEPEYVVGANGIAYIVLEPTTITGKVEIDLPFSGRKKSRIVTWLKPEVRDWIMVGLAEGTMGYNSISGNQETLNAADVQDEFYGDGRVAFYAKGKVKGEWLLTTAYDTAKETLAGDNRVNQLIDPNTYYTIYGDNSRQRHDASSADKLYIKIEREQFYALYGDMDTGLTITELSRFSRRMTGVKSEGEFERFAYTAFAAENKNNFIKDEIQGEGISGLYRLSGNSIVINSDEIIIETRDRFRSEIIIKSEVMKRYLDYSIDYQDGTVFFRKPIPARDENFNPVFIVANYEVETAVTGDLTAGGRVSTPLNDGAIELGASIVHDGSYLAKGELYGADARIEIAEQTEIRLEAASSDVNNAGKQLSGNAFSAEVVHGGDRLKARAYAKQQDTDFGLGQQSISQSGTRKVGVEADYRLNQNTSVDATLYNEEVLNTSATRKVAETNVRFGDNSYALNAGARIARDRDSAGNANNSNLLILGGSKNLLGNLMKIHGTAEIAVGSADTNPDYPSRYIIGADYFITSKINLFAENEWTFGGFQDTQMARAGVRSTPWTGAQVNSAVNQETNENGIRSFATLGLTQSFPISKRWSGDIAFDQAKTIRTPGANPFNPNVPIAQGTDNNDYTAVSFGTTYNADTYTLNNRIEVRDAQSENKLGVLTNWERNLMRGIGYSASVKLFNTDRSSGASLFEGDVRFSLAYRPMQSRWIVLNRLDFKFDSSTDITGSKTRQRKLIENFASNFLIDNSNQIAFNAGLKYVVDNFDSAEYSGLTGLLGTEYRHDLNERFDIGVHASTLYSANSGAMKYATGVSVGWNMMRNIWLSVGYNFSGFEDDDFSAAGYTASGPYIRFRMKFDQDTADELRNWMN